MDDATPLGDRIAYYRRRRGLSQVKLAGLLGRSESWLSQVERGVRSIDRISVLTEVAAALNVPVTELTPDPLVQERAGEHPTVRAVRLALSGQEALAAMFKEERRALREQPDFEDLRARAEQAWELTHAARYADLGKLLPALIADLEAAARPRDSAGRQTAFLLLAEVYQATAAAMSKLRDLETAWVAGDRSISAAERGEDPGLAAAGAFRIAHALLSSGRLPEALRTALTAAAALEPDVAHGSPELVALWGALNQVAAVIATRAGEEETARACLRKAEEAAERLPSDRNDFHTEFGRANVALHAVSIAVELGDAGDALRRAGAIDVSTLSAERQARFLLDVARAYAQRRKAAETVRTLEEAEALTPEHVRSHPMVREMVRDLLRRERRTVNPALRALAQRVGVLPNPQF
ncbi:MAG TPA: helix-turn-helix transcriptional regulator [Actinomycetes bacterium]|nr:helix-turn-helix transcriptional regulator [Actinomycetes bacterium]